MALKYPDRLESNNPAAYGIVKATEISGHRTVQSLDDLYSLADAILSDSGNNTNNDAIGQKWYVISETKEYKLIDWNNRKSSAGWEQDSNYLPLTGGTMTGDIVFSSTDGIIINSKSDQDLLNAAGGTTSISDILSSTEGSLSDLEARVKANEDKLVIVQGEETVDGSIKKALKDAKDYTDQKLAWTILE